MGSDSIDFCFANLEFIEMGYEVDAVKAIPAGKLVGNGFKMVRDHISLTIDSEGGVAAGVEAGGGGMSFSESGDATIKSHALLVTTNGDVDVELVTGGIGGLGVGVTAEHEFKTFARTGPVTFWAKTKLWITDRGYRFINDMQNWEIGITGSCLSCM